MECRSLMGDEHTTRWDGFKPGPTSVMNAASTGVRPLDNEGKSRKHERLNASSETAGESRVDDRKMSQRKDFRTRVVNLETRTMDGNLAASRRIEMVQETF